MGREQPGRIRSIALTQQQRAVVERITTRLDEAAAAIEQRRARVRDAKERFRERDLSTATRVLPLAAPPGFADVDQERRERALLINGSRGEGKTTVLMKLIDAWNQHAFNSGDRDAPRTRKKGRPDPTVVSQPADVFVVALPMLDLPAMPRGADVPLASLVVNCFAALVNEMIERDATSKCDHRGSAPRDGLRERWEWLHRSLASKYSHASKRHGGDLLQHARELQDDTRRVYEIDDRFRLFVDALSDAVERSFDTEAKPAVFVIAIDDLDLAAEATPALLDVLRVFQHPAVFFLMTGDRANLHRGLRSADSLKALFYESEMTRSLEVARPLEWAQLASDIIERVFPQHSVFHLEPTPLSERLDLKWGDSPQTVRELFVELGKKAGIALFERLKDKGVAAERRVEDALPTRMRHLVNLCHRLSAMDEATAGEIAYEFWRSALSAYGVEFMGEQFALFSLVPGEDRKRTLKVAPRSSHIATRSESTRMVEVSRPHRRFQLSTKRAALSDAFAYDDATDVGRTLNGVAEVVIEIAVTTTPTPTASGNRSSVLGASDALDPVFVRSFYRRESFEYEYTWPLPDWRPETVLVLRQRWSAWMSAPRLLEVVRDARLSVVELFLFALLSVSELSDKWPGLQQLDAATGSRAVFRSEIQQLRDQVWRDLETIVQSPEQTTPMRRWLLERLPVLFSTVGWDESVRIPALGFWKSALKAAGFSSARAEHDRVLSREPVAKTGAGESPSSGGIWESFDHFDESGEPSLLRRPLALDPRVQHPLQLHSVEQYLAIQGRELIVRALDNPATRDRWLRSLESMSLMEPFEATIEELRALRAVVTGGLTNAPEMTAQTHVDRLRSRGSVLAGWLIGNDTEVGAVFSASPDPNNVAVLVDELISDLHFDAGRFGVPASGTVSEWPGVRSQGRALWFAPALGTETDWLLLAEGWNRYRLFGPRRQLLPALGAWLHLCHSIFLSRRHSEEVMSIANGTQDAARKALESVVLSVNPMLASYRAKQWASFVQVIPLFACPDAGLDPAEARLLLEWLQSAGMNLDEPEIRTAVLNAHAQLYGAHSAKIALATRKLASGTHPWDKLFSADRPSEDEPASSRTNKP
jgi:hypothetical protein